MVEKTANRILRSHCKKAGSNQTFPRRRGALSRTSGVLENEDSPDFPGRSRSAGSHAEPRSLGLEIEHDAYSAARLRQAPAPWNFTSTSLRSASETLNISRGLRVMKLATNTSGICPMRVL